MRFNDSGFVIGVKSYGENASIVKIFCRQKGIHHGFVKQSQSQKIRAILQLGSLISFDFYNRIDENLGSFSRIDLIESFCGKFLFDKARLNCAQSLLTMLDDLFLEHEPFKDLFDELYNFFTKLADFSQNEYDLIARYIRLELIILRDLGYEIDLSSCVVTNAQNDLVFVSPKSARAVSYKAGEPYASKLLTLPQFLINQDCQITCQELIDGLKLTEFFLQKFLSSNGDNNFLKRKFWHRAAILDRVSSMMS